VPLRLDSPGLYSFDCPIAEHAGRGVVGLILLGGEIPPEASWTGRGNRGRKSQDGRIHVFSTR
jgi:hypothetical protein